MDIVVVGANSQLGQCLQMLEPSLTYLTREQLDLADRALINRTFAIKPKIIINCAAFTAVDLAGEKKDEAVAINATAVGELANHCETFIHVSTDYVFSGEKNTPYTELDTPDPVSHYGLTKLEGERLALGVNPRSVVVRTSWLYSEFGKNFYKRMLELAKSRPQLKVVYDQVGSPTYAGDLAQTLLRIAKNGAAPGIYHYSNEGVCSWYDFAREIFRLHGVDVEVSPILSAEYPTPTRRPHYSVLDKSKIKNELSIEIPHWAKSLERLVARAT